LPYVTVIAGVKIFVNVLRRSNVWRVKQRAGREAKLGGTIIVSYLRDAMNYGNE
jgi:hypothetical protein